MRREQGCSELKKTFKHSEERHWCGRELEQTQGEVLAIGTGCVWELTHCADFLEVRAALHVVLTAKITVAVMLSRIPFPTSPCTA